MRIGLDARDLNREVVRGQGHYLREIVTRCSRSEQIDWWLFADRPDLPFHTPISESGVKLDSFDCRGYRFHAWEQFWLPIYALRRRVELLHCPGMRLPWWQPIPTVVTLHDAMPWLFTEEGWPRGYYADRLIPAALRKSAAIITVSQNSRKDIVSFWPNVEHKIWVIANGIDERFLSVRFEPMSDFFSKLGVRSPYFLYLGGSTKRKRLEWAIRVWEAVGDEQVQLVVCGVEKHCWQEVMAQVAEANRARLCLLPFVPEEQMPRLYQNAVAVLYPTLYEGFGLPALEAQAVGTPVLFSDVGSLSELKGPAACVLPTDDLEAWVSCCRRLLAERSDWPQPIEAARRWAMQFSWDESARKHLEVYKKVARTRTRRKTPLGNNVA